MRRGSTRRGWGARIRIWRRSRRRRKAAGFPASSSPTSGDPLRSARLGALLYLYRGGHREPLSFRGELHADELAALADLTEDDRQLTNACLEVERELLDREWQLVSLLLAGGMFGDEEAGARLREAAKRGEVGSIARELGALMDLGLLD